MRLTKLIQSEIKRRKSRLIYVGDVPVGGNSDISVQSMTNTLTTDVRETLNQIKGLEEAGADLIRVSVPDEDSVRAFKKIKLAANVPLIADIHFDYKIAIKVAEQGADCLRINPGNIGNEKKVREVINCAKDHNIPIRIGVNAGSLEKKLQKKYGEPNADALVESAMNHVNILKKLNFENFKLSIKASDIFMMTESYRKISLLIDQPLHLGLTEAGGLRSGTIKSSIAIGQLLREGIGDTLRVSLAADPREEIKVGFDILRSLKLRKKGINFIACPSCARQNFDVIKTMNALESRLEDISETLDVAVIGCYVNGPGESKAAHVGLTGASPNNLVYIDGKPDHKLTNEELVDSLEALIRKKAKKIRQSKDKLSTKEV
ncbi:MAG: flavodoxin-dependent (E)-4-hydroxy-3-methylbut-2-enyl-diphosphate synthase [Gammaproteobacteria bacterium]|tara:strand:+ start:1369 stop:2496 length:1128 start_codon:yes stop_codon:yes gene_type:complete